MKYRFKGEDGKPGDASLADTWRRVAHAIAQAESPPERARWARRFEDALSSYEFLPAGRILAGAGTGRNVTLFNCFVMGLIGDDMASIFDNVKEAALTMQQGGGIGYDFSTLRPRGAAASAMISLPCARAARPSPASGRRPRAPSPSWMCGTPCAGRSCRRAPGAGR